ncbi:MAG: hypothetical protein HQL21_06150 [Candidatus Omnitrophica bacterium]|nr:hypothetical protein [Candidatus Omnitrophota bacterium]
MLKNNNAQSIMEYTAVAMFLMIALIAMGPFLKGSVNAHFKMLNESVQDAANEKIGQQ